MEDCTLIDYAPGKLILYRIEYLEKRLKELDIEIPTVTN